MVWSADAAAGACGCHPAGAARVDAGAHDAVLAKMLTLPGLTHQAIKQVAKSSRAFPNLPLFYYINESKKKIKNIP